MSRRSKAARLLLVLSVAYAIFIVLVYILEVFLAERHWLTTLITYVPQHIFLVPVGLLVILSLFARRWWALGLNVLVVLFAILALLGFNIPHQAQAIESDATFRVMTYNILRSQRGAEKIAATVADADPNVLFLQEAYPLLNWSDARNEIERVGGKWHKASYGELTTMSRYPIVRWYIHPLPSGTGSNALVTVLDVDGEQVTMVNVHFSTAIAGRSLRNRSEPLSQYLKHTAQVRFDQLQGLMKLLDSIDGPLILAGDFNTPPRGRFYGRLSRNYSDAFSSVGWGFGHTYRSDLPVLRIDYIFVRDSVRVKSCRTLDSNASDHRPLVADVWLSE